MAGWIPTPADLWAVERGCIEGRWPSVLAVIDLRYWDDPKACNGRTRPSSRTLAKTWGWAPTAVLRLIRNTEFWADSSRRKTTTKPTQSRGKRDAAEQAQKATIESLRRTLDAEPAQTRRKTDAALKETRPRTPTPHPHPSSSSSKKKNICPGFDELAVSWADEAAGFRKDNRVRPPKQSSKGEPTKGLKQMLNAGHTVADLKTLIRWHWHGPDKANNRRDNRGLMTLARHVDRYIVAAADWATGKRTGGGMSAHPDDDNGGGSDLQNALLRLDAEQHNQHQQPQGLFDEIQR